MCNPRYHRVMHVHAQVDLYHLRTDHPYKYISSSRYANIHTLVLYPRNYPS